MVGRANVDDNKLMWALRLHVVDGVDHNTVADFLRGMDGAYLLAEESEANRVHFQGWLITGLKDVTLRARLKKSFPMLVGNKGYSLKPVKEDTYVRYCLKGTRTEPPVVVAKYGMDYTDEWIENEWRQFWAHEKSDAYELKKAKASVTEVIWAKVEALTVPITPTNVVDIIVDVYTAAGKPYDEYGVRRLRNVILSKYYPAWRRHMKAVINMDSVATAFDTHIYNGDVVLDI